jgi:hypothetical protein
MKKEGRESRIEAIITVTVQVFSIASLAPFLLNNDSSRGMTYSMAFTVHFFVYQLSAVLDLAIDILDQDLPACTHRYRVIIEYVVCHKGPAGKLTRFNHDST